MPFRPGEYVPESGRYWVHHYQHRLPQLVEMKAGKIFPHCKKCKDRVTFERADGEEKTTHQDNDLAA